MEHAVRAPVRRRRFGADSTPRPRSWPGRSAQRVGSLRSPPRRKVPRPEHHSLRLPLRALHGHEPRRRPRRRLANGLRPPGCRKPSRTLKTDWQVGRRPAQTESAIEQSRNAKSRIRPVATSILTRATCGRLLFQSTKAAGMTHASQSKGRSADNA